MKPPPRSWSKSSGKDKRAPFRRPVVAGIFYPQEKRGLVDFIDRLVDGPTHPQRMIAVLVPHGGYLSCASVYKELYSRIEWPVVPVILGPSHAPGAGKPISIVTQGTWETPVGALPIDEELGSRILSSTPQLEEDALPHEEEHAIEVELPFLQRIGRVRSFVPIIVGEGRNELVEMWGEGLARALRQHKERVLLMASTNLSRYEPLAMVKKKDHRAIDRILALDEMGLLQVVKKHRISMCGTMAAAVAIVAAKHLGATSAHLASYQVDVATAGESSSAVGYAAVCIQ